MIGPRVYQGTVVHKRLRPQPHALAYRVFSLLLDVDTIDTVSAGLRLFSRNRFNALSFHDRDHGAGDGRPVADHARAILGNAGFEPDGFQILLLAYPRVFGYAFNPVSTYFCFAGDQLAVMIYEVNNTFGERRSYVVAAGQPHNGVFAHGCAKSLYVSPFTPATVDYSFHITAPAEKLVIGVALRDADGPLLKTHFAARARPLTDRVLAGLLIRLPLMTLKVIAGIHFEAARLWLKGVPPMRRHRSPAFSVSNPAIAKPKADHAGP